jgi:hypothetical protein
LSFHFGGKYICMGVKAEVPVRQVKNTGWFHDGFFCFPDANLVIVCYGQAVCTENRLFMKLLARPSLPI